MTPDDRRFLKHAYQAVLDEPLEADEPRYVELSREAQDPVELLARGIDFSSGESVQLVSGFRGTGKSTMLRRLRRRLLDVGEGYEVVLVDIERHLDMSAPVEVLGFLSTLADAFDEAMSFLELLDPEAQPRFQRDLDSPRHPAHAAIHEFFHEHVRDLKARQGRETTVILLVDSIEHIGSRLVDPMRVQDSVDALFVEHFDKLRIPDVHVVYTVPPYTRARWPALGTQHYDGPIVSLPAVTVRTIDGIRDPRGVDLLKTLVARRVDPVRLMGDDHDAMLERLIACSGGNVRHLLRLLAEILRRARSLPVSTAVVDDAIRQMRVELLPTSDADVPALAHIAESHALVLGSHAHHDLARWTEMNQVLQYHDDGDWYDVHPLIRNIVLDQARALPRPAEDAQGRTQEPTPPSPRVAAAGDAPVALTPEMRVTLVVQSYRALRRVRWTLPRGVSALVGPNGSGKTTLLDVPSLLRHALEHDVRRAVDARGGPGHLRNQEAEREAPVVLGVELDHMSWRLDLAPRGASFNPLYGERGMVDDALAFDRGKPPPALSLDIDDARPLLPRFADLTEGAVLRPLVALLKGYRFYVAYDLQNIRVNGSQVASDEHLHPDGRNIFSVLRNWRDRKETRPRWEFVVQSLRETFPETFEDLDFDMAGQTVSGQIVAPRPDLRIPIYFAANGLLVALLHLAAVASTAPAGVVAIDEVENGLHPYAIRRLIEAMRGWAARTGISVLLATHSPIVIDQFREEPSHLFVMEPSRDVTPVRLDELHDPEWLAHFSLGDLYAHEEFGAQHKDGDRIA